MQAGTWVEGAGTPGTGLGPRDWMLGQDQSISNNKTLNTSTSYGAM